MLQSMGLQRVRHDLAAEPQQQALRDEIWTEINPAEQYKDERVKIAFFFSFFGEGVFCEEEQA